MEESERGEREQIIRRYAVYAYIYMYHIEAMSNLTADEIY